MPLTTAQQLLVKNDILATPQLNAFVLNLDGAFDIANLYNKLAVPDFVVWKNVLHEQEIASLTSPEATVWSWTAFIARSIPEHEAWARMFNGTYTINPSLAQVRSAFTDIFSGGTGAAQRTHLLAMSKEKASRIEKLLATGAGTTADPATRSFVGNISPQDIANARAS